LFVTRRTCPVEPKGAVEMKAQHWVWLFNWYRINWAQLRNIASIAERIFWDDGAHRLWLGTGRRMKVVDDAEPIIIGLGIGAEVVAITRTQPI
jgi:hypothetical protein